MKKIGAVMFCVFVFAGLFAVAFFDALIASLHPAETTNTDDSDRFHADERLSRAGAGQ